jgi:hypothetical protein
MKDFNLDLIKALNKISKEIDMDMLANIGVVVSL